MNDDMYVSDSGAALHAVHGRFATLFDDEADATVGDAANLLEVSGWLRDVVPAMTVEQFRRRSLPHVMTPWRVARA